MLTSELDEGNLFFGKGIKTTAKNALITAKKHRPQAIDVLNKYFWQMHSHAKIKYRGISCQFSPD